MQADCLSESTHTALRGAAGGASGKEPTCQCRRHKRRWFDPWVRKIPWRRAWQPTPVFLPGESLGQRSLGAIVHMAAKSQTRLKQFNMHRTHAHSSAHPFCTAADAKGEQKGRGWMVPPPLPPPAPQLFRGLVLKSHLIFLQTLSFFWKKKNPKNKKQ